MFQYKAKLIKLDKYIEELGVFVINGIELVCFIAYAPFQLKLNKEYLVELNYQIFDEYEIHLTKGQHKHGFVNINNYFNYYLHGVFKENILSIDSIQFVDDYLLSHFTYLENKEITLFVDRLDIAIDQQLT